MEKKIEIDRQKLNNKIQYIYIYILQVINIYTYKYIYIYIYKIYIQNILQKINSNYQHNSTLLKLIL